MLWVTQDSEHTVRSGGVITLGRSLQLFVLLFPVARLLTTIGPAVQKLIVLVCLLWLMIFCIHLNRAAGAGKTRPGFAGRERKRRPVEPITPGTFDGYF